MEDKHRYIRLTPSGKKLIRYRVVCACCGPNRNWLPDAEVDRLNLILPDDDEAKVIVLPDAEVYPDGETLKAVRRICP